MTDLEVKNQSKIRFISKQKLVKYIDSKNTLKTVLACSEPEINGFLCFDKMMVIYATSIRDVNMRSVSFDHSKHIKPFISAPGLARAILSVFLDHLAYVFPRIVTDCVYEVIYATSVIYPTLLFIYPPYIPALYTRLCIHCIHCF